MASHHNYEMDWKDESSVGWLPYIISTAEELSIPAHEIKTGKWTASDVHVKSGSERYSSYSSLGTKRRWRRLLMVLA